MIPDSRLANIEVMYGGSSKRFSIRQGRLLSATNAFSAEHSQADIFAFPGLINSHDHLEFNLFPLLARRTYQDYKEWATDIHLHFSQEIRQALDIPLPLRIGWGILKNIVNGITTIVHHGGDHHIISQFNYPVYVQYQYLHSLGFDKWWKLKVNYPWLYKDLMVHIGEGTSPEMTTEIDQLIWWNFFKRKIIGIHAIGILPEHAQHFKAIIWCPDSNLCLYNKTAEVEKIKHQTSILFGTDSNLSASSNFWEQLRTARGLGMLSDEELFAALTTNPRQVFKLDTRQTSGNWVIARRKDEHLPSSFYSLNPEDIMLVIANHQVVLADTDFVHCIDQKQYSPLQVNTAIKWLPFAWSRLVKELERLKIPLPLPIRSV